MNQPDAWLPWRAPVVGVAVVAGPRPPSFSRSLGEYVWIYADPAWGPAPVTEVGGRLSPVLGTAALRKRRTGIATVEARREPPPGDGWLAIFRLDATDGPDRMVMAGVPVVGRQGGVR